jgi:hypothetical protein
MAVVGGAAGGRRELHPVPPPDERLVADGSSPSPPPEEWLLAGRRIAATPPTHVVPSPEEQLVELSPSYPSPICFARPPSLLHLFIVTKDAGQQQNNGPPLAGETIIQKIRP